MAYVTVSSDEEDCVLMSVIHNKENEFKEQNSELYQEAYKENELLAEFIKKCVCLENSKSMEKTLKLFVLKKYYAIEKSSRESTKVQKAIRRAINLVEFEPHLIFTHIKNLCDILNEIPKVKKKVPFITLSTELTASKQHECKKARLDTEKNSSDSTEPTTNNNNIIDTIVCQDENGADHSIAENSFIEEDSLLIPKTSTSTSELETSINERIETIKKKIAHYNEEIKKLDAMEVDDDSEKSPYIKSERLQSSIVLLYQELCDLTGSESVKRKQIRLRVVDGHPPGPTKVLEEFLNNNIGSNGDIEFPDFYDVVKCVTESNDKDDLGWNKNQILREASSLFTMCGRALQKRRQEREYRYLISKVKVEEFKDPADDDPELLKRLEENKKISIKNESDILQRYAMMQSLPPQPKPHHNEQKTNHSVDSTLKTVTDSDRINEEQNKECVKHLTDDDKSVNNIGVTNELNTSIDFVSKKSNSDNTLIENEMEVSTNVQNGCTKDLIPDKTDSEKSECFEPNVELDAKDGNTKNETLGAVQIKQEREDVAMGLENMGDDFNVTIAIIKDPFVVIDISSDSSDEEVNEK